MRQGAALPFEAFKFTGSKRTRPIDQSGPAVEISASNVEDTVAIPSPPKRATTSHPPKASPRTKQKPPLPLISTLPPELLGDVPLRLIICGHNPSEVAWRLGHYYANPSNWMWRILRETEIAPLSRIAGASDDYLMPEVAGVGFTDVGSGIPGTDSSQFTTAHFEAWRQPFYDRLAAHMTRASANIGCTCGTCGAPAVVAFSGKRQFSELFSAPSSSGRKKNLKKESNNAIISTTGLLIPPTENNHDNFKVTTQAVRPSDIPIGRQMVLPSGWPLPLDTTEVWVMTSTSGAAALTREKRYAPWQALAERIKQESWPRYTGTLQLKCASSHSD